MNSTYPAPTSKYSSAALENAGVVTVGATKFPVIFYGLTGRIDAATPSGTYFAQALKAPAIPSNGAVTFVKTATKIVHTTGADTYFNIDNSGAPQPSDVGFVWCISTTEFTKTLAVGVLASVDFYYSTP